LADRYDIQSIKRKCEYIFAQHITVDAVCQIFKYAHNFNCERLKETCLLYTEENHQEVITSVGFEELDRDEMLQIVRVGKEKKRAQHGGGGGNRKQG
jgi:BTB And C-terminal Kelch.